MVNLQREGTTPGGVARRQIRRAWSILLMATLAFLLVCSSIGAAGYWYRGHATTHQTACAEVVQGDRAFVRPVSQRNWVAIPKGQTGGQSQTGGRCAGVELQEGDALQTSNGTHILVTFANNSTAEIFERSELTATELRMTQYISRASFVTLQQTKGLIRVTVAPGDYSRSRFQVLTGRTTVLMKEGEDRTGGGSFVVQVTPNVDDDTQSTVRASVRRGVGAVRVAGESGELRLEANEQTIVPPQGPASQPTPARRDLIANGQFTTARNSRDEPDRFAPWIVTSNPGPTSGVFGRLTRVTDEIDGQQVSALEIARSMSSIDPANTGLRQSLDLFVTDLTSLTLTADIKVFEQNLPGGGQTGTEYPIIVRINYYDASGAFNNRVWGFSILPAANGQALRNGELIPAESWYPLRKDLRDLLPQPVRLESIEVYASGHGYRARITNVAIVGDE